jgi:hypothetical protein
LITKLHHFLGVTGLSDIISSPSFVAEMDIHFLFQNSTCCSFPFIQLFLLLYIMLSLVLAFHPSLVGQIPYFSLSTGSRRAIVRPGPCTGGTSFYGTYRAQG